MSTELATRKEISLSDDPRKALFKEVAMDVGKEICAYIEVMYPEAVKAASSTFLLSVRNSVYNEIIAVMDADERGDDFKLRLKERKEFRRHWKAQYKAMRARQSPSTLGLS